MPIAHNYHYGLIPIGWALSPSLDHGENEEERPPVLIRNMTPHPISLKTAAGLQLRLPSDMSGPTRVASKTSIVSYLDIVGFQIPITSIEFGKVYNLPPQENDTYLICSRIVQQAMPQRNDIVVPDSVIRDGQGRIICCQALALA